MSSINTKRLLLGAFCAGVLMWLMEGAASTLYMDAMQEAMKAHNISMDMTPAGFALSVAVSLLTGFALVFFYAAARPRFGPGPKTALLVALVFWLGAMLVSILGYKMMGLFPTGILVQWAAIGLVELLLSAVLGAWIYREG